MGICARQVAKNCDVLFVAVKPNVVSTVLQEVSANGGSSRVAHAALTPGNMSYDYVCCVVNK
eukprot:1189787-Prorocentrum_minimum.AAC.4